MIHVQRGPEPKDLEPIRRAELARLRSMLASGAVVGSKDIGTRYQSVAGALWTAQFYKCCYCESREQQKRNDVEHFRPKGRAIRGPGSTATHGYWWLAWTWENLLFACRNCNQSPFKLDKFPLEDGSTALVAEDAPPKGERPLLIDPATESGIDHIKFVRTPIPSTHRFRWVPTPRNGSAKGKATIAVCGLGRPDLLDLYGQHVDSYIAPETDRVRTLIESAAGPRELMHQWEQCLRWLSPSQPFAGLSFDAIDHFVPEALRNQHGLALKLR